MFVPCGNFQSQSGKINSNAADSTSNEGDEQAAADRKKNTFSDKLLNAMVEELTQDNLVDLLKDDQVLPFPEGYLDDDDLGKDSGTSVNNNNVGNWRTKQHSAATKDKQRSHLRKNDISLSHYKREEKGLSSSETVRLLRTLNAFRRGKSRE